MTKNDSNEQDGIISTSQLNSQSASMSPILQRLRVEAREQVEAVDWSLFQAEVENRIERETEDYLCAKDPSLSMASRFLRQESETQAKSVDWSLFQAEVEDRVERDVHATLELEFEPDLAAWKHSVLSSREGQWSAFTEQIIDAVHRDQIKNARLPLAEQTVKYLREEIEVSVDTQEARFERDFFSELQNRIEDNRKTLGERILDFFGAFLRPVPLAWGSAAFALAIALFFVRVPLSSEKPLPVVESEHRVLVEAVQFEGTVTLSQSEDLTVIWLASAS